MKKNLLLIMPLLFGAFLTSCNNDPKTEPVNAAEFIQNLNAVKKQAEAAPTTTGLQFTQKASIETDLEYEGNTAKLFANSTVETKVNDNKSFTKTTMSIKGDTITDGVKESADAKSTTSLWTSYANETLLLMVDVANSGNIGKEDNSLKDKVYTEVTAADDIFNFDDLKENVSIDYSSYTVEQVETVLNMLVEAPGAKLGYVKKGDTEVFTANFELPEIEKAASSTSFKVRFDNSLITKFELTAKNSFITDDNSVQVINIEASMSVKEYTKNITLPDKQDFRQVNYSDFDDISSI